ncbi:glycoside hydrolase family 28 protein [Mucilaginibacter sp. HMF5004]|uniref:glycosyl hydrolase family 28 protein n=1 Tax=Mucilaginibacter rivuli TaxID=2857527 RepID=UPI001C5E5651|nr:glycoside hydrolase family 28 protein [Mucilaginibacter rivuli]MBW4891053.1 glycoside hydrolase family 28 protein [Mucilaginibacter rivuli]
MLTPIRSVAKAGVACLMLFYPFCFVIAQQIPISRNLVIPEASITANSVTLLWDKPDNYENIIGYQIFKDGVLVGKSAKTNYTVQNLPAGKTYTFTVKAEDKAGKLSKTGNKVVCKTKPEGKTFNILDFGAKGDGETKNTTAIQKAINACTPGGTVYIPNGTFLSGAIYLKSNMTLYIAEGGTLKGSTDTLDYLPLQLNRFEGWELKTYASFITAGTLDRSGKYNVENLSIQGKGTISGGGLKFRDIMLKARGKRGRGRLICIMNGNNIDVQGLNIEQSPCWNIHYIYSANVTLHDLNITSYGANADGIDPDSSTDSYIFNCTIATDDDCIAIKSGKNPEGNIVNKPTERVRITDCTFTRGAALAIGSEMSGGVSDVFIQDCKIGNLKNGFQVKTTKDRGGYVKNIVMRDCSILKITMVTNVNYNNDGAAAPELAWFKDIELSNLDMSNAKSGETLIDINGFPDEQHYTLNVLLKDIRLPQGAKINVKNCDGVSFNNVLCADNAKPVYNITESKAVKNE